MKTSILKDLPALKFGIIYFNIVYATVGNLTISTATENARYIEKIGEQIADEVYESTQFKTKRSMSSKRDFVAFFWTIFMSFPSHFRTRKWPRNAPEKDYKTPSKCNDGCCREFVDYIEITPKLLKKYHPNLSSQIKISLATGSPRLSTVNDLASFFNLFYRAMILKKSVYVKVTSQQIIWNHHPLGNFQPVPVSSLI